MWTVGKIEQEARLIDNMCLDYAVIEIPNPDFICRFGGTFGYSFGVLEQCIPKDCSCVFACQKEYDRKQQK